MQKSIKIFSSLAQRGSFCPGAKEISGPDIPECKGISQGGGSKRPWDHNRDSRSGQAPASRPVPELFSITSFTARFSRLRSAYIRLRRAFLYSSSRMRLMSDASMPPNSLFQVYIGGVADAVFAADILGCAPGFDLFKDRDDLLL